MSWWKNILPVWARQDRSYDVPEKVFVTNDGKYKEWSTASPSVYNLTLDAQVESLMQGFYADQNFIQLFYCLPEIAAPVNEIASRVADATWQLRKEWNDEVDYGNANFNRLFSSPNPLNSFKDFIYNAGS